MPLANGSRFEPANLSDAVYEWLWGGVYRLQNSPVGIEKATHLFPPLGMTSPQIKASDVVMLNSREFNRVSMVLTIVAYYYPTLRPNVRHPYVILRISREVILEVLYSCRQF